MTDALTTARQDYRARAVAPRTGGTNHLTQRAFAFVLAEGRGSRLQQLTDWRAKPAVPFAGKLKIIDFALSNCVNSGIRRIAVLTQYKAQSLIRHVERGWGFSRRVWASMSMSRRRSGAQARTGTRGQPTPCTRT
jgi:ADP-glucose pyrophosphorylase